MKKVFLLALAGLVGAQAVFAHTGPASQATPPARLQLVANGSDAYAKDKTVLEEKTHRFGNLPLLELGANAIRHYIKCDYRTMMFKLSELPFFLVVPNQTSVPYSNLEIAGSTASRESQVRFRMKEYPFCLQPFILGQQEPMAWQENCPSRKKVCS